MGSQTRSTGLETPENGGITPLRRSFSSSWISSGRFATSRPSFSQASAAATPAPPAPTIIPTLFPSGRYGDLKAISRSSSSSAPCAVMIPVWLKTAW